MLLTCFSVNEKWNITCLISMCISLSREFWYRLLTIQTFLLIASTICSWPIFYFVKTRFADLGLSVSAWFSLSQPSATSRVKGRPLGSTDFYGHLTQLIPFLKVVGAGPESTEPTLYTPLSSPSRFHVSIFGNMHAQPRGQLARLGFSLHHEGSED